MGHAPLAIEDLPMTNERIASTFERVAALLEEQGASPFRVRAWRDGAQGIREHHRELTDVFRDHGRVGLEAVPHIGPRLSAVIIELIRTGRCAALDRLRGAPGHLPAVPLSPPANEPAGPAARRPPVALLLEIDREYRAAAEAGRLHKIAPHRQNPKHEAWLPIMHGDRDGWSFTAVYSNTELAHRLGRTHDWVVVFFHEPHGPEGQATVVTEHTGPLRGLRVVRGRERECRELAAAAAAGPGKRLAG
jgi:DNA polymerase (family 10)